MRIAVTGSTGTIGSTLVPALRAAGHEVRRLVRARADATEGDILWQPSEGRLDPARLAGIDGVIHLSGENLAQRWTSAAKSRIRESRVRSTEVLARAITLVEAPARPRVLITASAVGIYGSRGDERLDERSTTGDDFLAEVGREWEGAAGVAKAAGIRVVHTRSGVVMSSEGGMLGRLRPIFKMGVGGRIGSGKQWLSWIAMEDEIRAFLFLLEREDISGPVNVVSPEVVTNAEFTRTLGEVLGRPTVTMVPELAVKLAFGEMGEKTVLASQRVEPRRLREAGFEWRYPRLEDALRVAMAT